MPPLLRYRRSQLIFDPEHRPLAENDRGGEIHALPRKGKEMEKNEKKEQEEMISIRLPLTKELQNDVFVRVNHRTWLIKRGETVKVPACVVEVLEHADQATAESLQFQAAHESRS